MVVVFVDGVRNYMTKLLSKDWMIENKFISVHEYDKQDSPYNKFSLEDMKLE